MVGVIKRSSVRPSVGPVDQQQQRWPVGLLLKSVAGSRYRSVAAAAAAAVAQHAGRVNFDPTVRRSNILVLGEDPDPPREVARRCGYLPNYFDHSLPQM